MPLGRHVPADLVSKPVPVKQTKMFTRGLYRAENVSSQLRAK